jgi:hypothetical protein
MLVAGDRRYFEHVPEAELAADAPKPNTDAAGRA